MQLEPGMGLDQWLDVLHQGIDFGIAIDSRREGHLLVAPHAHGAGPRTRRKVIAQPHHTVRRDQGLDDGIAVSSESLGDRGWVGRHGTCIRWSGPQYKTRPREKKSLSKDR